MDFTRPRSRSAPVCCAVWARSYQCTRADVREACHCRKSQRPHAITLCGQETVAAVCVSMPNQFPFRGTCEDAARSVRAGRRVRRDFLVSGTALQRASAASPSPGTADSAANLLERVARRQPLNAARTRALMRVESFHFTRPVNDGREAEGALHDEDRISRMEPQRLPFLASSVACSFNSSVYARSFSRLRRAASPLAVQATRARAGAAHVDRPWHRRR